MIEPCVVCRRTSRSARAAVFPPLGSTEIPCRGRASDRVAVVDDWNRRTRFGGACVDDSGDPVIELDLLLAGGITTQTIKDCITVFAGAALKIGAAVQP